MTYQLSICLCLYNKYAFTKSALTDLFRLPATTHEIIVFDNGSSDETQNELSKIDRPNFKYLRSENNLGFAGGSNRAYAEAQAPNVLFINNDIRVKNNFENWTQPFLPHCLTSLVGPTMGQLDQQFNFVKEAQTQLTGPNVYMSGWCLASSKAIFDRLKEKDYVGPFSEDYFCYFEDTYLGFKAAKLGIPFQVVPVPVVHFGKISSQQLNTHRLYTTARQTFLRKIKELR